MHVSCRCVSTPVPIGSTYRYQTGEAWLREQGEGTQRAMFPSLESYDAWKADEVQLRHFVGHRRSQVWGSSIVELSGREAIRRAG